MILCHPRLAYIMGHVTLEEAVDTIHVHLVTMGVKCHQDPHYLYSTDLRWLHKQCDCGKHTKVGL